MKQITFKLVAYSAAAGKYDPDAPNMGNEDNFYVDDNLSDDKMSNFTPDNLVEMSECGMLMVVADGMGGMNAGEVASDIAIKTVSGLFSPGNVTAQMAQSPQERRNYLEKAIITADHDIKQDARTNPKHSGMGSTIIIAWLVGDELTVSWCGDSRCYRFNPATGIELLSRDHSYVQELADKGIITYEQTFGHPQGNIVTHSLGDENGSVVPETRDFKVYKDDIIMLCSDGLSGVVFDRQFYLDNTLLSNDNLEDIIRANQHSLVACREALFAAAEKADWYDNVTVLLCQICDGVDAKPLNKSNPEFPTRECVQDKSQNSDDGGGSFGSKKKTLALISFLLIVLVVVGLFLFSPKKQENQSEPSQSNTILRLEDSISQLEDSAQKPIVEFQRPSSENKSNSPIKKNNKVQKTTTENNRLKEICKDLTPVSDSEVDPSKFNGTKKQNGKMIEYQDDGNEILDYNKYNIHRNSTPEDTIHKKHVVKKGDTMLGIARRYGVIRKEDTMIPENKYQLFLDSNKVPIPNPNKVNDLKPDQVIYIVLKRIS